MRQYIRRRPRSLSGGDEGILMRVVLSLLIVTFLDQVGVSFSFLCDGALIGDEQFGRIVGGAFWVFTSLGVSIVNPETCHLDHSFSQDTTKNPLPQRWSKGVYMVRQDLVATQDDDIPNTESPELLPKQDAYILINAEMPTDSDKGEVIILSTNSNSKTPVFQRIPVGGSLGNAYAVHNRNQVSYRSYPSPQASSHSSTLT
jgi:hypothetical protein